MPDTVEITMTGPTAEAIRDAITLLQLGAGDLLIGLIPEQAEAFGIPAFVGQLEIGPLQNATPFLLSLIRQLILAGPKQRTIAMVAGRIWLASHCSLCGREVEEARRSAEPDILCATCETISSDPDRLKRLERTEMLKIDQATMMAFIKDPTTEEAERDRFLILSSGHQLAKAARFGYRNHGRGAVIVDKVRHPASITAHYTSSKDAEESGVGWPAEEVGQWVKEYDPHREMIICILRNEGGRPVPMVYRVPIEEAEAFHEDRPGNVVSSA